VKVLALDYGRARTGVAVSDPTGELARPLEIVEQAATEAGLDRLAAIVAEEAAEKVVVGLPLTLKGEHGEQAQETERFVATLRARLEVPVELFDERFTSVLAGGDDARAAAHLLSDYLRWSKES
jgi:putative Holliday junction resolvase